MKKKVHGVVWAVAAVALCLPVWAAENGFPAPVDWSHKHLIITNAASPQQSAVASQDPRHISNWLRRTQALQIRTHILGNRNRERIARRPKLDRDWSVSLGAGTVAPAMSPAKYGFYTTSTLLIANCTTDWVVYGLNVAGSASQANLFFLRNLYSGSNGYCGAATIAASPSGAVRNASGVVTVTTTTAHKFTVGMLVAIANVTDTSFNGTCTVATVPSTTSFTCNTTNTTPSNSGGGVASFASASVMAAYNVTTQAGGKVLTSPSLSLDGTKVVFVESTATASIFHILTLDPCTYSTAGCTNNGTSATSAAAPGSGNAAAMVSIQYSNFSNTRSSPWIDYSGTGAAYVGDDNGSLYRITNLFAGTPTLDSTFGGTGSVTVSSGVALLAPVLAQGWLLVGDMNGVLRAVQATSPYTVAASTVSMGTGMVDPPLVDASSTGLLSAFATASSGFTIEQAIFNTSSQTFSTQTAVNIGHSSTFNAHSPAFDNNYYLGTINATQGFIYACGMLAASQHPTLYRLGFTAGSPPLMSTTASSGATIVNSNAECSPLTEFANSNLTVKDFLFVGNSSGAVQSYNITGTNPTSPIASATEPGGTSGIIVDTTQLANQQGSSIYFTTQSNVGGNCGANNYCAIKLTQAALQ